MPSQIPPTAVERILSAHAGRQVRAGEVCVVDVDVIMATDGNAPLAIKLLREELAGDSVFDPARVVLVIDHCGPSPNEGSSNLQKGMMTFARETGARLYPGGEGISHVLMPERGHVGPGQLALGSDSHSVTYGAVNAIGLGMGSTDIAVAMKTGRTWVRVPETVRVDLVGQLGTDATAKDLALLLVRKLGVNGATYDCVEIAGPGLATIPMDGRLTVCNMGIEVGAKCVIMPCDEVCRRYVDGRAPPGWTPVPLDDDAPFRARITIDLSTVRPQVAPPHDLTRIADLAAFEGQRIDMAFIGTCTNSRLSDLQAAADVLRGRRIAEGVRLVVTPGSRGIYLEALREGLIETFVSAGAVVTPPGCGPCVGTHMGVPADAEVVISSANRNFRGRMGNSKAEIFLASPANVARAALAGHIACEVAP